MIKVIVGYRARKGVDLKPLLQQLQSHAMTYAGFKGCEIIQNDRDKRIIVMLSSWENRRDWEAWADSSIRKELLQNREAIMSDEPKVTIWNERPQIQWV